MGLFTAVGEFLGIDKNNEALAAQEAASGRAADIQKQMYDQSRADLAPYREAGYKSLEGMQDKDFQRDFTLADFQKDPGYQFRMNEGQKALERSASARGGLMSGAALKSIAQYGQNFASNEYQNAYNRFNDDRTRRFGRLSDIAHMGSGAATSSANNSMQYGENMSSLYTDLGNAQAAKQIADANFNSKMLGETAKATGFYMFCDKRLKTNIRPASKKEISNEWKRLLKDANGPSGIDTKRVAMLMLASMAA